MSSWRNRLCGSAVTKSQDEEAQNSIDNIVNAPQHISCGGGFFPASQIKGGSANMKTYGASFILPTKEYSVLIFKDDGSAVIYTDAEKLAIEENEGN
jgi:hypothetical protein